jgi:hypothetical protein
MSEQLSTPVIKRRRLPTIGELFLALVAIVCAVGWYNERTVRSQLRAVTTYNQIIKEMGAGKKEAFVDCKAEGDGIARYWLVREYPATWTAPAPDYVSSRPAPPVDDSEE